MSQPINHLTIVNLPQHGVAVTIGAPVINPMMELRNAYQDIGQLELWDSVRGAYEDVGQEELRNNLQEYIDNIYNIGNFYNFAIELNNDLGLDFYAIEILARASVLLNQHRDNPIVIHEVINLDHYRDEMVEDSFDYTYLFQVAMVVLAFTGICIGEAVGAFQEGDI